MLVSFLPAGYTLIPSFIAKSIEGISIHTKVLLEWRTSKTRGLPLAKRLHNMLLFRMFGMDVDITLLVKVSGNP